MWFPGIIPDVHSSSPKFGVLMGEGDSWYFAYYLIWKPLPNKYDELGSDLDKYKNFRLAMVKLLIFNLMTSCFPYYLL